MVLKAPKLPVNVNVPGAGLQAFFRRGSSVEEPADAPQNAFQAAGTGVSLPVVGEDQKRSKEQAYYAPRNDNSKLKCRNCKYFQQAATKCQLVSTVGYPTPGRIHPDYGCSLWNAGQIRVKTSDFLWGKNAAEGGVAPQIARYAVLKRVMARLMGKRSQDPQPPAGQAPYAGKPPAPRWKKGNPPPSQKWAGKAGGTKDEYSSVD